MQTDVSSIAIIGSGTMGSGIALAAATAGIDALQVDVNSEQLDRAKAYHQKVLGRNVEKERMTQEEADAATARITFHSEMNTTSAAQWAVEAASENLDVKCSIFKAMTETYSQDVVLATNTSSISITQLAATIGEHAHRVIGMHFFNPVPLMKLVEVIRGLQTSDDTVARTIALAESMGKTPIAANDRAGFVSNRVLMPMINEAFHAWMDGVAEPEAIDGIMQLGCNFPMGPLRLADFIGLDVCHDIMMVMYQELGEEKYFPCPKLRQLVSAGRLGDKTGHGVYEH